MPERQGAFATVVLVDRTIRATAGLFEFVVEPGIAEEWLGRAPDVAENGIRSWGGVTSQQILRLLELCGDEDGVLLWGELLAKHAVRDLFISLHWHTKE